MFELLSMCDSLDPAILERLKILKNDGSEDSWFGGGLAISSDGNTLAVGDRSYAVNNVNVGAIYVFVKVNDIWTLQQKITPPDLSQRNGFGEVLSITGDGNTIVTSKSEMGGATVTYVYTRAGGVWTFDTSLVASEVVYLTTTVGGKISTAGNTIVAYQGFRNENDQPTIGAFIFEKENGSWVEKAVITDTSEGYSEQYPTAYLSSFVLSYDGTMLAHVVFDMLSNNETKKFVIHEKNQNNGNWERTATFRPTGDDVGEGYGLSMALNGNGNTIALGSAPLSYNSDGVGEHYLGRVYVYDRGEGLWTETSVIVPDDMEQWEEFGYVVTINSDGDKIAVGSPWSEVGGTVIIYRRSGSDFVEVQRFESELEGFYESFGDSLIYSSDGSTLFVGAPSWRTNIEGYSVGAVYVLEQP